MGLVVVTPPTSEPISLTEAKRHLRIAENETRQEPEIQGWIVGARKEAERISDRAIVAQTLRYTFGWFPGWAIVLPRPPLIVVNSVKYLDLVTGIETTLATTEWSAIATAEPGYIEPSYDASIWPTARDQSDAVRIEYVAGWPVTTVALAIAAGSQTVTPASMAGIIAGSVLTIDEGARQEQVVVTAVAATTFTAVFAQAHAAVLPIQINCVPFDIKAGMLLLIGHYFRNRDTDEPIPRAAISLLQSNWTGGYLVGAA